MIIGVGFGIGVGVVVETLLHSSVFTVGVAALITSCLAVVFGGGFIGQGLMFYNETAVSAILVVALPNGGTAAERLFDALVGGGIALLFSVLLFPAEPVALLRTALDSALAALSGTLTHLDGVIDQPGREPFDASWTTAEGDTLNAGLADVAEARATARQVIRAAPRRRAARPAIEGLERQATQITVLTGAVLNLARTTTAAVRSGEDLPEGLHAAIGDLAEGLSALASHDTAAASRAATRAVGRMVGQHTASPTGTPLMLFSALAARAISSTWWLSATA